jgi:hypothetical protein
MDIFFRYFFTSLLSVTLLLYECIISDLLKVEFTHSLNSFAMSTDICLDPLVAVF